MLDDIHIRLLAWYGACKRDLPWRRTYDPYAILVAETMLQQTGVERVIPRYNAFLAHLPALRDLADAPTADVIRLWAGLGYNRRAVYLQRSARVAIERWAGLPLSLDDLLSLPGVGPYTARAVACFAFGAQAATVDVNIRRVLSRLLHGEAAGELTPKAMLEVAESVLPPGRAYDWNQALMDLGATVCGRESPRCLICPLHALCASFPGLQAAPERTATTGEPRPRWRKAPFIGSRRYYRGRIVASLRRLGRGQKLTLGELGPAVKVDFAEADIPWLRDLVAGLVADGLATTDEVGAVALPV